MKTLNKKITLGAIFMLLSTCSVWAQKNPFLASADLYAKGGGVQGGGGDAAIERRIKDIRDDILRWIIRGDAKRLKFNKFVSYEDYLDGNLNKSLYGMKDILKPGAVVIISFSEKDENINIPVFNTLVGGVPKVCKGLIKGHQSRPTIVCNKELFDTLSDKEKYIQIHHEYAGLGGLERNIGADSDYHLSKQIIDFGSYERVFKLGIRKDKVKLANGKIRVYPRNSRNEAVFLAGIGKAGFSKNIKNKYLAGKINTISAHAACRLMLNNNSYNATSIKVKTMKLKEYLEKYPKTLLTQISTTNNGIATRKMFFELFWLNLEHDSLQPYIEGPDGFSLSKERLNYYIHYYEFVDCSLAD